MQAENKIISEGGFEYIETNPGLSVSPLILLHGLMGALSNFEGIIKHFGNKVNVVIPLLPIYTLPLKSLDLEGLVEAIEMPPKVKYRIHPENWKIAKDYFCSFL